MNLDDEHSVGESPEEHLDKRPELGATPDVFTQHGRVLVDDVLVDQGDDPVEVLGVPGVPPLLRPFAQFGGVGFRGSERPIEGVVVHDVQLRRGVVG